MKPLLFVVLSTVVAYAAVNGAAKLAPLADSQDTVRRTLRWGASGDRLLEVSNIAGSVHVVGYDGQTAEMNATRTVYAESDERLAETKGSIRLDATESAHEIRVCGAAERCGCRVADRRLREWPDDHREDVVDFTVRVPADVTLRLCTVTNGRITVEGVAGDFDVRNVNGGVELKGMRGSGRVETVNGSVTASFDGGPKTALAIKTINGDVEVTFPDDLSADLRLKTFNGGLYTDFAVTPQSATPIAVERREGRTIYRGNPWASVRVGTGGPELTLETLNGDVRVMRRK